MTEKQRDYTINRVLAEYALMGASDNQLIIERVKLSNMKNYELLEEYTLYTDGKYE